MVLEAFTHWFSKGFNGGAEVVAPVVYGLSNTTFFEILILVALP